MACMDATVWQIYNEARRRLRLFVLRRIYLLYLPRTFLTRVLSARAAVCTTFLAHKQKTPTNSHGFKLGEYSIYKSIFEIGWL